MKSLAPILFIFLFFAIYANTSAQTQSIETGKFQIFETKQQVGEETYTIRRDGNGLIVESKINLPYMGEEQKPQLTATLRTTSDFTPQSFTVQGIRPLEVAIDTSITVAGKTATVREQQASAQVTTPERFFTLPAYMPVTTEMMLIRYWLNHERKNPIALLPHGEAIIDSRGRDAITRRGKTETLNCYHLSGTNWSGGWGRQTLWLDAENRLVAAVNLGSEVETNLTAIRDGYDSLLSFFLKRAVEDGIDRLTQLANQLSPRNTRPIVLLGATLIDVKGNPAIPNSAVVIQGDRIAAVGPRSQVPVPENAITVDLTGKYVLPGLWDMHAHFYQVEFGPTYLAAGITSARDVGNEIEFGTALRDAAKLRRGLGPRMMLAGYIDGKNDGHSFDIQVDTPDEARAAVQHYKQAGFEQIKIRDNVKLEILKVITAEAHRLGMTVTGHVPKGLNALQAVEAGMDQISHLNFAASGLLPNLAHGEVPVEFDPASADSKHALQLFLSHHTVVDPTMAVLELMLRPMNMPIQSFEPDMNKVPPELIEQLNKKGAPADQAEGLRIVMETFLRMIVTLHRAGVPIVAGTDVGVPGYTLHRELELYVKAGLSPLEAIQTATITPARVMKLENEVGTIETGKRADIIVLDADPLASISNIRTVRFVIAQGRMFESAKLWQTVGFKPAGN
jgi:imidazolonepropionase-like amidohydrolase